MSQDVDKYRIIIVEADLEDTKDRLRNMALRVKKLEAKLEENIQDAKLTAPRRVIENLELHIAQLEHALREESITRHTLRQNANRLLDRMNDCLHMLDNQPEDLKNGE